MNIILDKNIFLAPIAKLASITEKKSLMPILSNLLIEFGTEKTKVYSTDLEISAIGYLDYKVETERKIILHGRKLLEILREMDNGDIDLEIRENMLIIKQKKSEFVLGLQDPEEFPEVKEIKGHEEFILKGNMLLEMINKVGFAVSVDETRYVLTGMYMKGMEGKMVVVGTDGYRMSLCQKEIEGLKAFKGIIIPKRSIAEIERIIEEKDEVKIIIDDKHVQVSTNMITLISRTIEGNFPDYDNVIPENNINVISIDKETFYKGIKKVSAIIGRSEPIRISFLKNKMEIEAEADVGSAKEIIDINYEGEEINMNFNVRFIMDVVSHIQGDKIIIKTPEAYGAVLFEGEEGKDHRNIIMPIRI
ncbi:MAG: DNA polymerase III subunit beta [Proteobacteria bacterium]|nr:DNA polymerase III subunit beta [Pseudomonadota bacterium]